MSTLFVFASVLLALLAPEALAFSPPTGSNPCTLIGGCMSVGAVDASVFNLFASAGQILVTIAGGAAVLFLVIGGAQMMLAFGDEGKFTKGTQNIIIAVVGFAIVLGSQVIVGFVDSAAGTLPGSSPNPIVDFMAVAVDAILSLFNVVFVGILVMAGIKVIIGRGKADEFAAAKKAFGYALAGAIAINIAHSVAIAVLNAFA